MFFTNKFRQKIVLSVTSIVLISSSSIYAISDLNIKNDSLDFYMSRYCEVEEVEKYLSEKGVDKDSYKKYVQLSKIYRYSMHSKWEDIETGVMLVDVILFSTQEIKKEYSERLKNEKDQEKVYDSIKKDLINNPLYVLNLIEEILKDEVKMKEVFKEKYGRVPTEKELSWLVDKNNLKYALYGGELGREITENEYLLIKQGYGYKLLGLKTDDIEEYSEYVLVRDKIVPLEVGYYNSIEVFTSIYTEIYDKYKVDIFKSLTEEERLEIHINSVTGINFDQEKAYKLIEKKLEEKGLIKETSQNNPPVDNGGKSESINQDLSSSNPYSELNGYLKENISNIRDALMSNINEFYTTQKIEHLNGLKETYIYFRYKDKVVNTYTRLYTDGRLSNSGLDSLCAVINESLNSKMYFSRQEILLFVENEIKTSELELKDNILFKDLVSGFSGVGIELYEEPIMKEDESEDINSLQSEKIFLQIDLNNESYQISFFEGERIRNVDLKNLLEMMGMRYIFTQDSVLVLNQGKVFIVETDAYSKGFVTAEDVKKILLEVGLEVTVKVIYQKKEGINE